MVACSIDWPLAVNAMGSFATLGLGFVTWRLARTVRDDSRQRSKTATQACSYLAEFELKNLRARTSGLADYLAKELAKDKFSARGAQVVLRNAPSFAMPDSLTRSLLIGDIPGEAVRQLASTVTLSEDTERFAALIRGMEAVANASPHSDPAQVVEESFKDFLPMLHALCENLTDSVSTLEEARTLIVAR